MILRRSKRTPVPKTIYEEKGAPSAASDPKITKKTARTAQKTALKPIAISSLSKSIKLNKKNLSKLSMYNPSLKLQFQALESLATGLLELKTFQRLLRPIIINRIIVVTNSYTENA
jgi:hypothetical protein